MWMATKDGSSGKKFENKKLAQKKLRLEKEEKKKANNSKFQVGLRRW